ncbi:MAG: rhamnulokinase [Oscillospiraceae bacterium]|nr:rhamnulokinase [Oscillospiraceae bacterium]
MVTKTHLAIDIGASSGRHILGWLEDGQLKLEEVHRFHNEMTEIDGALCWDVDALFDEIITGLKKCAGLGHIPCSLGIDTWGVDFVLLDGAGMRVGPAVAYRDSRTDGIYEELFKIIPETELYSRVGLQKQPFNSINQLLACKLKTPQYLQAAEHLLFMPDYLHYRLCGVMKTEYTIASTSGLVNAQSKNWDEEVIERMGFPRKIFKDIVPAGTVIGSLTENVKALVGFDCEVVMPPSHDTASAFLAVPAKSEDSVYISSGTWSLMGVELPAPVTTEAGLEANFTNEGGYDYRYRFLKNIMGLWILQSVRKEIASDISFAELVVLARKSDYDAAFDVNEERFFAPQSMSEQVRDACKERGFSEPQTPGDYARCIYQSLADSYAATIKTLQALTGKDFNYINIIGGGSANGYLNELTAKTCGITVYAGPSEGTALGNIVSQMIAFGQLGGIEAARKVISDSFDITEVLP